MKFTIKYASTMTGLSEHRIRAWEKRYGLLNPERTNKGRRLYSDDDIEQLTLIALLIDNGAKIGEVCHMSLEQLREKQESLEQKHLGPARDSALKEQARLKCFILEQSLQAERLDLLEHELEASEELSTKIYLEDVLIPFYHSLQKRASELPAGRTVLVQRLLANSLQRLFIIEQGKQSTSGERQPILIGSTDPDSQEIDSWVYALRFLLEGTPVLHIGFVRRMDVIKQLAQSFETHKVLLTDKVDGPTKEWRRELHIQEAFSGEEVSESPLQKEVEILLLLQGLSNPTYCPFVGAGARVKPFTSFDSLKQHLTDLVKVGQWAMPTSA